MRVRTSCPGVDFARPLTAPVDHGEAKVSASILIGTGFGLVAGAVATAAGTAALRARGIDVQLDRATTCSLSWGVPVRPACGRRSVWVWALSFEFLQGAKHGLDFDDVEAVRRLVPAVEALFTYILI